MTSRKEFESWVLNEYSNQHMGKFATCEYHSTTVEHCWKSWQASRAALAIATPKVFPDDSVSGVCAKYSAAMKASGLKVKP